MSDKQLDEKPRGDAFSQEAEKKRPSLFGEFLTFLRENKKWWLLPILLAFLVLGLLVLFASTGAAPFIYTLF